MEKSKSEEILNSLDGITRAKAQPYMHTRVMARLQEENNFWGRTSGFLNKPLIAFSCLFAVVFVNIFFILKADYAQQQQELSSTLTSTSVADLFQNDNYILAVNDVNLY